MQCPLHTQKVNKPGFHGTSCQLAPSNIRNTQSMVLSNSSVLVASVIYGEWRWQPQQNLVNSVFIPYMSASVIECISIVQGSWSRVSTFNCYSHFFPLTVIARKGVSEYFSRICAIIQIKYVSPKLSQLPQYSYGFRDPTTQYSYRLGTRDRTHTGASDTVWQHILILYSIGLGNGLPHVRRQVSPMSDGLEIPTYCTLTHLGMSSANCRPFCPLLDEL